MTKVAFFLGGGGIFNQNALGFHVFTAHRATKMTPQKFSRGGGHGDMKVIFHLSPKIVENLMLQNFETPWLPNR